MVTWGIQSVQTVEWGYHETFVRGHCAALMSMSFRAVYGQSTMRFRIASCPEERDATLRDRVRKLKQASIKCIRATVDASLRSPSGSALTAYAKANPRSEQSQLQRSDGTDFIWCAWWLCRGNFAATITSGCHQCSSKGFEAFRLVQLSIRASLLLGVNRTYPSATSALAKPMLLILQLAPRRIQRTVRDASATLGSRTLLRTPVSPGQTIRSSSSSSDSGSFRESFAIRVVLGAGTNGY